MSTLRAGPFTAVYITNDFVLNREVDWLSESNKCMIKCAAFTLIQLLHSVVSCLSLK